MLIGLNWTIFLQFHNHTIAHEKQFQSKLSYFSTICSVKLLYTGKQAKIQYQLCKFDKGFVAIPNFDD